MKIATSVQSLSLHLIEGLSSWLPSPPLTFARANSARITLVTLHDIAASLQKHNLPTMYGSISCLQPFIVGVTLPFHSHLPLMTIALTFSKQETICDSQDLSWGSARLYGRVSQCTKLLYIYLLPGIAAALHIKYNIQMN